MTIGRLTQALVVDGNDNETLRSPLSIMPAGFLFRLFPQRSPPWLFDHSSLRWLEINN
jgi:hypothetical protein